MSSFSINRSLFTIRREEEISVIESAIKKVKKDREFPIMVLIKGSENSGKSLLLNEAKNISAMNEITHYALDLKKNSEAKILATIFASDANQGETLKSEDIDYTGQKVSLFEHTFINMNKKTPFVLAIDNFNSGYSEFFDFFTYILRKQEKKRERILFVIACNNDEITIKKVDSIVNEILKNKSDLTTIELEAIPQDNIIELLSLHFEKKISIEVIDYIFKTSDSKIGKLADITNFLTKKEYLTYNPEIDLITFSSSFYDIEGHEIADGRSEAEELLLSIIAVYKKPIDVGLLLNIFNRLANTPLLEINAYLTKLEERGLLVRSDSLYFSNKYEASLYYQHISPEKQKEVHNTIGLELEKNYVKRSTELCDEIGEHFYLAGNSKKLLHYLKLKAERAYALGFVKDALNCYNKLLNFLSDYNSDYNREERLEILFAKTRIHINLYDLENAKKGMDKIGELVTTPTDILLAKYLSSRILVKEGKIKEAITLLDSAILFAEKVSISQVYYKSIILKAHSLILLSRYKEAIDLLINQTKTKIKKEYLREELTLKNLLGLSYSYIGKFSQAKIIYEEVLTIAKENNEKKIYSTSLHNLGILHYQLCNFDESLKFCETALTVADQHFDIIGKAMVLLNVASIKHRIGKLKEAIDLYNQVVDLYSPLGEIRNYENVIFGLGLIYANIGLFTDASTVFLDEVGEMSIEMQKKLLRFLQTGEFRRIGEDTTQKVDVRIISATNRDLKK